MEGPWGDRGAHRSAKPLKPTDGGAAERSWSSNNASAHCTFCNGIAALAHADRPTLHFLQYF
ncbi:hypothetical protein BK133_14265 [Paenibacillus sp. FSL H8-0548]|nr:hypothetical protein BK133_14265 [Paenibacillus sp. FSL H8-0548]